MEALEDQKPVIKFTKPGRDVPATNLEEVFTEVRAEDDFGVNTLDIYYSVNGKAEKKIEVFKNGTGEAPREIIRRPHVLHGRVRREAGRLRVVLRQGHGYEGSREYRNQRSCTSLRFDRSTANSPRASNGSSAAAGVAGWRPARTAGRLRSGSGETTKGHSERHVQCESRQGQICAEGVSPTIFMPSRKVSPSWRSMSKTLFDDWKRDSSPTTSRSRKLRTSSERRSSR